MESQAAQRTQTPSSTPPPHFGRRRRVCQPQPRRAPPALRNCKEARDCKSDRGCSCRARVCVRQGPPARFARWAEKLRDADAGPVSLGVAAACAVLRGRARALSSALIVPGQRGNEREAQSHAHHAHARRRPRRRSHCPLTHARPPARPPARPVHSLLLRDPGIFCTFGDVCAACLFSLEHSSTFTSYRQSTNVHSRTQPYNSLKRSVSPYLLS